MVMQQDEASPVVLRVVSERDCNQLRDHQGHHTCGRNQNTHFFNSQGAQNSFADQILPLPGFNEVGNPDVGIEAASDQEDMSVFSGPLPTPLPITGLLVHDHGHLLFPQDGGSAASSNSASNFQNFDSNHMEALRDNPDIIDTADDEEDDVEIDERGMSMLSPVPKGMRQQRSPNRTKEIFLREFMMSSSRGEGHGSPRLPPGSPSKEDEEDKKQKVCYRTI